MPPVFYFCAPSWGYVTNKSDDFVSQQEKNTETRRRSEVLESTILQAAWVELNAVGYVPQLMNSIKENKLTLIMKAILNNAEKWGEVALAKINERVIALPIDLLRYELLTTHEPLSEQWITEIIDDIFTPLVRA
ncbi:TetR-like C-terminal domain-containing protein [Paenibacillus sp. GCM10012306]|uniref:TetR-like C-terminal domain-containing protein n=1 Tax=Paenibacillus sp. GCM10012306 TaxID=3317342 RepID=UPI00361601BC